MENMQVEVRESFTHTFDINQVQVQQTPGKDVGGGYHDKLYASSYQETGHHPQVDANEIARLPDIRTQSNALGNSELLQMVRKQEVAWENAEAAVHKLDRRLRLLERSDSLNKASLSSHIIHDTVNNFPQFPVCNLQGSLPVSLGPPTAPCSCVYASPAYADKTGNIMYRSQPVEDRGYGFRSRCIAERIRGDEKDLEMKRLRLDLQRQDLEMRRLKAELHKMKALEFDDDRNVVSDKYVDKVNTMTSNMHTLRRPQNYHEGLHCAKPGSGSSHFASDGTVESPEGYTHSPSEDGLLEMCCGMPQKSNLGPQGSFKSVCGNLISRGRREHVRVPSAGSELERCVSTSECFNNSLAQQLIVSLVSTMQVSVENLCNNMRMREQRDTDSSKIDCGAIDDELFILKKTLCRLQDACQEADHESLNCVSRDTQVDADKEKIDGILQQIAQAELKVIALESSCVEKEKRLEDLESQLHSVLKEREALIGEKYEFTNVIHEMQQDAAEQRHRIEELLSINEDLLEISQAEENKLGTFQETRNKLVQQVVQYEDNCANFESLLQDKEKQLEELNRKLKAGQIGADTIIFEKFELLNKVQTMQTESEEQKKRIDELVSINEELLEFAQIKEDQVAYLGMELDRLSIESKEREKGSARIAEAKEEQMKEGVEKA